MIPFAWGEYLFRPPQGYQLMRDIKFVFVLFISLLWHANAAANTDRLDNLAACAGVVIGNGAIDFFIGDESAFDSAANIAYTAYLSEVFSGQYEQSDLLIADQILGGNLDKVIAAYNSDTFDSELYEEIVGCYRMLSEQLLDGAIIIIENQDTWQDLKETSIATIKRFLRAG